MNQEIKTLWVQALRSKTYTQGQGDLRHNNDFCCLGVLCNLAVEAEIVNQNPCEFEGNTRYYYGEHETTGYLPNEVMKWAGLLDDNPFIKLGERVREIATLNDEGTDFETLANLIEAQF